MIPFKQPAVCPETEKEEDAFDELEDLVSNNHLFSSLMQSPFSRTAKLKSAKFFARILNLFPKHPVRDVN